MAKVAKFCQVLSHWLSSLSSEWARALIYISNPSYVHSRNNILLIFPESSTRGRERRKSRERRNFETHFIWRRQCDLMATLFVQSLANCYEENFLKIKSLGPKFCHIRFKILQKCQISHRKSFPRLKLVSKWQQLANSGHTGSKTSVVCWQAFVWRIQNLHIKIWAIFL